MANKLPKTRMEEILRDALPSCGTHTAEELPDEAQVDFLITMTIGEWRAVGGDK